MWPMYILYLILFKKSHEFPTIPIYQIKKSDKFVWYFWCVRYKKVGSDEVPFYDKFGIIKPVLTRIVEPRIF